MTLRQIATLIVTLLTTAAHAGTTIGIADGDCVGRGRLTNAMAPDFDFVSVRGFFDGWIRAQTTVNLLGHDVSAKASLVIRQAGAQLEVFDRAQPDGMFFKKVGSGVCGSKACRFDASVMGGKLYLRETIRPTARGFDIVEGFQKLYGVKGTYTATFVCKPLAKGKPSQLSEWIEAYKIIKTIPDQMGLDEPAPDISQPPLSLE